MNSDLINISFTINGRSTEMTIPASLLLIDLIRDHLSLKGTKPGCREGECGACTVLIDGEPVNSCLYPAVNIQGKSITTVEGLSAGALDPIQQALIAHGAIQCGFCTPGMIMAALDIVRRRGNDLDEHTIREQLDGNICRCTGYHNIVKAIAAGAKAMARGGARQAAE